MSRFEGHSVLAGDQDIVEDRDDRPASVSMWISLLFQVRKGILTGVI
jgi:hypothetical protein